MSGRNARGRRRELSDNDSRKSKSMRPENARRRKSDAAEKLPNMRGKTRLGAATVPMRRSESGIASVRESVSGNGGAIGMAVIAPGNAIALALAIAKTTVPAALRPLSPRIQRMANGR